MLFEETKQNPQKSRILRRSNGQVPTLSVNCVSFTTLLWRQGPLGHHAANSDRADCSGRWLSVIE
jgi:hypothetical protein